MTRGPEWVVRSAWRSVRIGWLVCSVLGIPLCPSAVRVWVRVNRSSCLVVIGLALRPRDRWPSGLCLTLMVADITFHRCPWPIFRCFPPFRPASLPQRPGFFAMMALYHPHCHVPRISTLQVFAPAPFPRVESQVAGTPLQVTQSPTLLGLKISHRH